jgi:hypothetical protein
MHVDLNTVDESEVQLDINEIVGDLESGFVTVIKKMGSLDAEKLALLKREKDIIKQNKRENKKENKKEKRNSFHIDC